MCRDRHDGGLTRLLCISYEGSLINAHFSMMHDVAVASWQVERPSRDSEISPPSTAKWEGRVRKDVQFKKKKKDAKSSGKAAKQSDSLKESKQAQKVERRVCASTIIHAGSGLEWT